MQNHFRIHIFNPETDIILGLDTMRYTPPKQVKEMRRIFSLLPTIFAGSGDVVLIPDDLNSDLHSLPFFNIALCKEIKILTIPEFISSLPSSSSRFSTQPCSSMIEILPWGWNKELCRRLGEAGLPHAFLSSEDSLTHLRRLAGRDTTIKFFQNYKGSRPNIFSTPVKLETMEQVKYFIKDTPEFCIKAPWSSSGRGLLFSNTLSREKTLEWTFGIIRSQGFVMGERKYSRKMDFATEWTINHGEIDFLGFSVFSSSNRGKYQGNQIASQEYLVDYIKRESNWDDNILSFQREFLTHEISPYYDGPVGIDMLVTQKGEINPCVEINLRRTMGHIAIELYKGMTDTTNLELSSLYRSYCPDNYFNLKNLI